MENFMKKWIILAIFCAFGGTVYAKSMLPKEHINAMACLENMETSTTWSQCLGLIFAPCSRNKVGSELHLSCLQGQNEDWNSSMQLLQSNLTEMITLKSVEDLTKILSGWINYVSQKCQAGLDAAGNPSAKAKQLGCQITETVGLTGEYAACLEGRSTAEYCVMKD
jgi:hypothetical protein